MTLLHGLVPRINALLFFSSVVSLLLFRDNKISSVIEDWWGGPDWELFKRAGSVERADIFCKKYIDDLNYKWAHAGPIFDRGGGQGRIM